MSKPWDLLLWAETAAMDGLTALAFLTNQNHAKDGDICKLKSGLPTCVGMGVVSDTKPAAGQIIGRIDDTPVQCQGAIDFAYAFGEDMKKWPHKFLPAPEELTGYADNTNVNEGTILAMALVYGDYVMPSPKRYKNVLELSVSITSGTDILFNDGQAVLSSLIDDYSSFIDTNKNYEIIGSKAVSGQLATLGGVFTFKNLSGIWTNSQPGLIINGLSAVLFNAAGVFICPYPIPIKGSEFETVTGGFCSATAGAGKFTIILGEV